MELNYTVEPLLEGNEIKQGEEHFKVTPKAATSFTIRYWDYDTLYSIPRLYEKITVGLLKSTTHVHTPKIFERIFREKGSSSIKILDYAAGVGLVGEQLRQAFEPSPSVLVGMDVSVNAKKATLRDRPKIYDNYLVGDLANPDLDTIRQLKKHNFNCIFCLSAVGTGDAGIDCFREFLNLLPQGGWIVFNVRDEPAEDQPAIIDYLKLHTTFHHQQSYFHRHSLSGKDIFFQSIVVRKN